MHLGSLKPGPRKNGMRKGRGNGSGVGKTAGRGSNGQKSRSGGGTPHWFEGGQMPLYRRMPQRGFNNKQFKKVYQIVNLDKLTKYEKDTEITPKLLQEAGIIDNESKLIKILGDGDLKNSLKIQAHKFSKSALEKIKNTGGEAIKI